MDAPIPITVLAGFLGSGKTTLLQNLLTNNQGLRIAIVVNDVASVNIDSKLVASNQQRQSSNNNNADGDDNGQQPTGIPAGMVELQNGCACCSKSEELLASVADLVALHDMRVAAAATSDMEEHLGGFDHIVIELSGVADPVSVRSKFQEAAFYQMPLLERVRLDTMVTLVDCSTFTDYLHSSKTANPDESPDLFYRPGESQSMEEYDGISTSLLAAMGIGFASGSDSGVAELIVSQTETADVVVLNKVDLATTTKEEGAAAASLEEIGDIVKALNPRARVIRTAFGKIALEDILGVAQGLGVVHAGIIDDHKEAVHAVSCDDPTCGDPSHSHNDHEHQEIALTAESPNSHHHSGTHVHAHAEECEDPGCVDASHSHTHNHKSEPGEACQDVNCADPTHSHSHDRSDTAHAGIGSFVYRARRPFHPARLLTFLKALQLKRGLPEETNVEPSTAMSSIATKYRILRSKGFAWCANSDRSALYWSQAGPSFDMTCLGAWWATLTRDQWPSEATSAILQDFDSIEHKEDDPIFASVGDRRQEIVFIGHELGDPSSQVEISSTLDQCLLDDHEWNEYVKNRSMETALASAFPTTIQLQQTSY